MTAAAMTAAMASLMMLLTVHAVAVRGGRELACHGRPVRRGSVSRRWMTYDKPESFSPESLVIMK